MSFKLGRYAGSGGGSTPTPPVVPAVPTVQTTLPTSAYGQTIPVVFGKCRLPAAYIWCAPIVVVSSTSRDGTARVTSTITCRLRFARPLVPDSSWTMRKLYADGKAIYDATIGYRQKNLKFRVYDGRSTQGRDPSMVAEEGEENVSAHRGYLDVVIADFDIVVLGAPPVFEAEWIQDGATTHDYDVYRTFAGAGTVNLLAPDWESGVLYGRQNSGSLLRRFSIGAQQEYFSADNSLIANYFTALRYSPRLDKLIYLAGFIGVGDVEAYLVNPLSGAVIASSGTAATTAIVQNCAAFVDLPGGAVLVGFSSNEQLFSFYFTGATVERAYQSAASFGGYSNIECMTPGAVRGSEFDVWLCADADLVKVTFTALGTFKSSTVVATLTDDLRYAVYDDGDLIVWTDAATVKRINGTTGATEFTKTVPYQIETVNTRDLGSPDLQRLVNELYFFAGGSSFFTNLETGETRTVTGGSTTNVYYFDGEGEQVITTTGAGVPQRLRIIAGNGEQRLLTDFLQALFEAGGFDPSEIAFEGDIDDLIQGAVVDITANVRDIARSVCEPYSIAIFER